MAMTAKLAARRYIDEMAKQGEEAYGVWFHVSWAGRDILVFKHGCGSRDKLESDLCELLGSMQGEYTVTSAAATYVRGRVQAVEWKTGRNEAREAIGHIARRPNGKVAAVGPWRYNGVATNAIVDVLFNPPVR